MFDRLRYAGLIMRDEGRTMTSEFKLAGVGGEGCVVWHVVVGTMSPEC